MNEFDRKEREEREAREERALQGDDTRGSGGALAILFVAALAMVVILAWWIMG